MSYKHWLKAQHHTAKEARRRAWLQKRPHARREERERREERKAKSHALMTPYRLLARAKQQEEEAKTTQRDFNEATALWTPKQAKGGAAGDAQGRQGRRW